MNGQIFGERKSIMSVYYIDDLFTQRYYIKFQNNFTGIDGKDSSTNRNIFLTEETTRPPTIRSI